MSTGKPILRVGKIKKMGKSTPYSVMAHLSRSRPTPNANPLRTKLNQWLVGSADMDLKSQAELLMRQVGVEPDRLRKDAVLCNDIMMTVSPEWFRPDNPSAVGTWDENRLQVFKAEAEKLLRNTFGKRLIAAVLHLDESTPHIQAVVVPLMPKKNKDGWRLSSKDMFNPTSLGKLQDIWENQMVEHGVGRRTKSSKAKHTTIQQYYGVLEEFRKQDLLKAISLENPPEQGFLEPSKAYKSRLDDWKKAQKKLIQEQLKPLEVQAAKGRLYDAERRSAAQLRGHLEARSADLAKAYEKLSALDDFKARVEVLRKTPIHRIAALLGYTGEIGKRENAIDLVMRVGEMDYRHAVGWLAQNLGAEVAATAAREYAQPAAKHLAKQRTSNPVLTKAERVKRGALKTQLDALAAPAYRITVMQEREGKKSAWNLGKGAPGEAERFFTEADILSMIPRLTAMNAQGGNLFITPIDDDVHHVLIDDLSSDSYAQLVARGYQPCLVQESSPGSIQAVIKVPKTLPKAAVNQWFKDINRDLGDPKITGLRHGFRLSGFQNMKPKHAAADAGQRPFVRILEAANRLCGKAAAVIQQLVKTRDLDQAQKSEAERSPGRSEATPSLGKRQ